MLDWFRKHTGTDTNYNFYVKNQPENIDTSTTLTLTAYKSKNLQATIPCHFKWYRIKNGVTSQVPQFRGSSFICQPSDVGSIIQAQIVSNDSQHNGTAILQFGPVKLDLMLKKPIQSALASGRCAMNAYMQHNGQQRECQISVFEDRIKITPMIVDDAYTFQYSMSQPRLEIVSKDPTKVAIIFNEKYESEARRFIATVFNNFSKHSQSRDMASSIRVGANQVKLDLKFASRSSKDIFLFTAKAFNTKRQLKSSLIINKIERLDFNINDNFNYILEIESLRGDLLKMYELNKRIISQRQIYQKQVKTLEKQIQNIVSTYLKIIQQKCGNSHDLNESYSILSNKKNQITNRRNQISNDSKTINQRLKAISDQVDQIRLNNLTMKNSHQYPNRGTSASYQQQFIQFGGNNMLHQIAFKKKQTNHTEFVNMLDELNESEIIKKQSGQEKYKQKIHQINNQKEFLKQKLQQSLIKIDQLKKKINDQSLTHSNHTAIQFTYGKGVDLSTENNRHNITGVNIMEYQKIINQNKQLKNHNENLISEFQKLKNSNSIASDQSRQIIKLQNQITILRMQLKSFQDKHQQDNLRKQIQSLLQEKFKMEEYVRQIQNQNNTLKDSLLNLQKDKTSMQGKYKKRIQDMNDQLDILRKNQDALNRSQHISMQMDNYNQQQLTLLKQQNQLLTMENQKLAKTCQKYMSQARQTTKLRQQIINLKEQLNAKLINPEKSILVEN